jgi:squalene-hopene/tetraprenyl-beta-curcumene cyclase
VNDDLHASVAATAGTIARRLRSRLLHEYDNGGFWTGRLCSSAVAGAVAVTALARMDPHRHRVRIKAGLNWIVAHANADGGWGDSPESPSNPTATLLCWNALSLANPEVPSHARAAAAAEAWLARAFGGSDPVSLRAGILKRYGNDRTFAAPILTMTALCGRLGPLPQAWDAVPQLPLEMALAPHSLYRLLNLTVVSYALPALIAIGAVRHRLRPSRHAALRLLRNRAMPALLRIAGRMQPQNGGYEEATPLTAFVALSLAAAGFTEHAIVRRAEAFLVASMRGDGSWPIDTNLSTWVTTLSVNALTQTGEAGGGLPPDSRSAIRDWLLRQQFTKAHPLTHGAPGGWSWSDLPGCMPDADDTAGALIALRRLGEPSPDAIAAAARGLRWLLDLQNRDGGIPTFSRGWGKLPFDRSCPDITAHTILAALEWRTLLPDRQRRRSDRALKRMVRYLARSQRPDGAWVPLWFGNQAATDEANRTFGTGRAVASLRAAREIGLREADGLIARGTQWLAGAANADGGWGGAPGVASTFEETGVALAALAGTDHHEAIRAGVEWMASRLPADHEPVPAAPIGLYFARLWYSERLYPVVFALNGVLAVRTAPTKARPGPAISTGTCPA